MNFEYSDKVKELQEKLTNFMNEHVYKNESVYKEEVEKGGSCCVRDHEDLVKAKAQDYGTYFFLKMT